MSTKKGMDAFVLLFFSHILPVADGHVLLLQAGVDAFADGDRLEVLLPCLLKELLVFVHDLHLLAQFATE